MAIPLSPVSMSTPIRAPALARTAGAGASDANSNNVQGGFGDAMRNALKTVSAAQNHSTKMQQGVQMEDPKISLEETMVAIQKAQIGFTATLTVRNRMVQAYSDIMNMQV